MRTVLIYRSQLLPISETFIRAQARALQSWEPVFVGRELVRNGLQLSGFKVELIASKDRLVRGIEGLLQFGRRPPRRTYLNRLISHHPSLVHAHFGTDGVRAWPFARALRLPLLVTLHGFDVTIDKQWWASGNGGRRMTQYPQHLVQLAQQDNVQFIAVSTTIREKAIALGIPSHKIQVHHIGIEVAEEISENPPLHSRTGVLFVGRLVEKKGCRYLIDAFRTIQEEFPNQQLIVVGGGPMQRNLQAYADERGVNALFLGPRTQPEVAELMRSCRAFCLPSITAENGDAEGLGLVIPEAQSQGVPVITSAQAAIGTVVLDGVTGIAVAEKSVQGLTDALRRLLSDDGFSESLARNALVYSREKMDVRKNTVELERIYQQVAQTNALN